MVALSVLLQAAKRGKKDKQKAGQKRQQKMKKGSDADSDASSEEDGYLDSKEMDYLSDTSSSSEGQYITVWTVKSMWLVQGQVMELSETDDKFS